MASLYTRGTVYWIDHYDRATRKHLRFALKYPNGQPVRNRTDALYLKAEFEREQLRPSVLGEPSPWTMPLKEAVEQFIAATASRRGSRMQDTVTRRLRHWTTALDGLTVHQLTTLKIERALNALATGGKRPLSAETRNQYLKLFRSFCRWCVDRDALRKDPTKPIGLLRVVKGKRRALTATQQQALLDRLKARDARLYLPALIILYTGLRWGELANLQWSDIEADQNRLVIRPSATWTPKGKRARTIPYHPALKRAIEPFRQESGYVWASREGRPDGLRTHLKKLGVEGRGIGWHLLRHTFATRAISAGISPAKVAAWLGHASWDTTQIYVHLAAGYDAEITRL